MGFLMRASKLAFILLLVMTSIGLGQTGAWAKPSSSPWSMFLFENSSKYVGVSAPGTGSDLATFSFPFASVNHPSLPAFLTTTSVSSLLGNLTGKTVSATISVTVAGAPVFTYGGQGTWNTGSLPANSRFFFSTSANTYTLSQSNNNPTNYWWSNPVSVVLDDQTGTALLTVSLDPGNWSDGSGQFGSDPLAMPGFVSAVQNVGQIGLAFGGGSFFDVGVALVPSTGTADFHLLDYQVN